MAIEIGEARIHFKKNRKTQNESFTDLASSPSSEA
jgi:hypothetical protein